MRRRAEAGGTPVISLDGEARERAPDRRSFRGPYHSIIRPALRSSAVGSRRDRARSCSRFAANDKVSASEVSSATVLPPSRIASTKEQQLMTSLLECFRLHYNRNILLSPFQAQTIGSAILSRMPGCNLLVFGLGNDTGLWLSLNKTGRTQFLESSEKWIHRTKRQHPALSVALLSWC
jgi:hypothetical protein